MSQKEKNIISAPDEIRWDLYIDDSELSRRELYIADHCCKPQFKYLLNKAKDFWVKNGGGLFVHKTIEQGIKCVQYYNGADLRNAMVYYVRNNPDDIKRMDRESAKRYRLRKKQKIAFENVSKGMSPAVYRGRVVWLPVQFPDDECHSRVAHGYYPTVENNKIVWEQAPLKIKG